MDTAYTRHYWITAYLIVVGLSLFPGPSPAQAYPQRPVRLIVPFPPGGGADILARIVGEKLAEKWRQQVVIDNRGGAGGTIGTEIAARAQPDGYTLLMASSNHPINIHLYRKLPYDPITDFAPVMLVGSAPLLLVVHPSVPARSVKELIALAKAKPGALNFGSPGSGSTPHLAAELFNSTAGIKLVHVPYKGSAQAMTDLISGQLSFTFNNMLSVLPHVKSGKLRGLGVTSKVRSRVAPDIPTISESGLPDYEVTQWWGMLAPAKVTSAIVAALNRELVAILMMNEVREKLAGMGVEPNAGTPAEFGDYLRSELVKWGRVVKDSGARVE
ncbi:MAG: tripartite tricarboxylate transporter substrate binding protein [Betaproteobacteria bacterium]|nr:tripartite tricarboxylate transporter substrate binding protein [Betaproteobacteria bacterium]